MKISNSVFLQKMLLLSLLMSTIPVIILGSFSYVYSSKIATNMASQGNINTLSQTQLRVEELLKSVESYYIVQCNSPIIKNSLLENYDYSDFVKIVEIQKVLNGIQNLQLRFKNINLYNFDMGWVVGSSEFRHLNDFKDIKSPMQYHGNSKNSLFITRGNNSNVDPDDISLVIQLPFNAKYPIGALEVIVSKRELNKFINAGHIADQMLILDSELQVVCNNDESQIGMDYSVVPFAKELKTKNDNSGSYYTLINNERVGVNYIRSEYNGWYYISIISLDKITRANTVIRDLTAVICFILIILSALIAVIFLRKMYKPVFSIYETITSQLSISKEGNNRDEFNSIGEGLNYLISNQKALTKQITSQVEQLQEFFILRLVTGELRADELDQKLKFFGYDKLWKWLCVVTVDIDSYEETRFKEHDIDLMLFSLNNIIGELLVAEEYFCNVIIKQAQVTVLGSDVKDPKEFKNSAFVFAENIQQTVYKYLKIKVSIGISCIYSNIKDTNRAYRESLESLKYRVCFGKQTILCFDDIQSDFSLSPSFPKNNTDALIDAIKEGDREKINNLLNNLIYEILYKKEGFLQYQSSLLRLFMEITSIIYDYNTSFYQIYDSGINLFDELQKLKTADEIKYWFKDVIIEPISMLIENKRKSQYVNIISEIISIIEAEYDKDITIESCAARLNYHPSYIWRVLKKELGMSFSEYLAQYRLNIAKQLLGNTNMNIGEIAEKLKYTNTQNFIRYFKKLEGVTPGQYRDSLKK